MAGENGNAALFMDLAGTLVKMDDSRQLPADDRGNIRIELLPNVADKLRPMRNYLFFVVTNQAGIRRGRFTKEQVEAALVELDRQLGGVLTAWQVCPHDDADRCDCRKPKPGMITELTDLYGVNLAASIMVGDQKLDQQAADAAGVGSFVYASDFFDWT